MPTSFTMVKVALVACFLGIVGECKIGHNCWYSCLIIVGSNVRLKFV